MKLEIHDYTEITQKILRETMLRFLQKNCFCGYEEGTIEEKRTYNYNRELENWDNFFIVIESLMKERRNILRNCPEPYTVHLDGSPVSNENIRDFIKDGGLTQEVLSGI